jgi:dTDP-4-amino-4,6-dideoxygalactose transaminase
MPDDDSFIPLVDLKAQQRSIREAIDVAVGRVFDHCGFILGPEVAAFEREFGEMCGAADAISCGSGTDAIHLACRALGIGPGDEVIVPAMTFVATALGVSLAGARPILVDVDPHTALIDLDRAAEAITPKTRAVMPVHLYGHLVSPSACRAFARKHGLLLLEDAAQAHGAVREGIGAGAIGDAGCFSFYPGKNLGAYGDGGLITVANPALGDPIRTLRNWGSKVKYHHEEAGLNSRLDTVQAAILRVKLRGLKQGNAQRARLAGRYDHAFAGVGAIKLTQTETGEASCRHLYVIRVPSGRRPSILETLNARGIGAGVHYPFAVHQLKAYQWLGYPDGSFPVAEDWARRCLSLPLFPEMTDGQQDRVIRQVLEATAGG